MDITITWGNPGGLNPTDTFNVLYKIYDVNDTYPWITANPSPLISTTTTYTITGLDPNVIYRVAVVKICVGEDAEVVTEDMFIDLECPLLSIWQGAPISGFPTLYYSVYYPNSIHVKSAKLTTIDSTAIDRFPVDCNLGPTAVPTGRTAYQVSDVCPTTGNPNLLNCNIQEVEFLTPSSLTSAAGCYGLDNVLYTNPPCNGTGSDPILYSYGRTYKFYIETVVQDVGLGFNITYSTQDANCQDPGSASSALFGFKKPDLGLISGVSCYDPTTCKVSVTIADGTNQTNINDYNPITYYTSDTSVSPPVVTTLPLVDDNGVPLTGPHIEYYIYCPIDFSVNPLVPGILSNNMSFEFWLSSPAPALIYTGNNLNYTGLTLAQVYTAIAADITAQTSFTAKYVSINNVDYIKIFVCGADYTSGEIILSGPNLLGVDTDIAQTNTTSLTNYGISDAVIYDPGAGDFIYGCRGLSGSDSGVIEATDIANTLTYEYNHLIDIPINQITLVDQPPPSTAYQMQHLTDVAKCYHTCSTAIVKNSGLWNDEFVYVTEDNFGQTITVYDASNNQIDSYLLSVGPVVYIETNQITGNILVLVSTGDASFGVLNIIHSSIGNWTDSFGYIIDATNTYRSVSGTITGKDKFQVLSSTATSITVAGNPWTNNQWSNYRIYVDTVALPDKQAVLFNYPTQPSFANNTHTIFIDPSYPVTFDASLLVPGDYVYFIGVSDEFFNVYDNLSVWPSGTYNGYDLQFIPNNIVAGIGGVRFSVSTSPPNELNIYQYTIGGYYSKTSYLNSTKSNLLPGLMYILYRNLCGGLIHNPINNRFYFSKGGGLVDEMDGTGNFLNTLTMLDSSGSPMTEGSFYFAVDSTGNLYGTTRSADLTVVSSPATLFTSPDLYIIDSTGTPQTAIDGSTRWGENISGRISCDANKLYFTSNESRTLIEYDIALDTYVTHNPPAVYKKSESTELIEGAVQLSPSKFVLMNRLDNAVTSTSKTKYLFTNLFIYDIVTDTIDTVLVGSDTRAYSGPEDTWNTRSLGEMFGEYNGFKDYCMGGGSINTYNGRVYFKQYQQESYYVFTPVSETGVAQLWCIGKNETASSEKSTYRLIRIFNIQSDGSLQSSVRTLYTYKNTRSVKQGPVYIKYDPYYNGVLGVTYDSNELILIDSTNFTGYYGGPNVQFVNLTLNSALSLNTNSGLYPILNPTRFTTDGIGAVYLFGKQYGSETYNYQVYFDTDIISESTSVSLSSNTGTPSNQGLFNTGYPNSYQPVYNTNTNTIWMMGNRTQNNPAEGDRIIKVYDVAMNVVNTINLTTLGAIPIGATYLYTNYFHIPSLNMMVFYGATNDKLLILHDTTYAVRYNNTASNLLNSHRTSPLGTQNIGWMVPYQDGFFIDRNDANAVTEFWTYLTLMDFSFIGYVHYDLQINLFNNDIFSLLTGGSNVTTNNLPAVTFGQWKTTNTTVWTSFVTSFPFINPNEVLELVMFDVTKQLIKVENLTTAVTWDVATYNNLTTLPTFNTLNSVNIFSIKADSINLSNGDILELTFENLLDPNCPFTKQIIVSF